MRKSLSLVKDKTRFSGSTCCFSVSLVTKKHRYIPGIGDATGGKAATPPIRSLCFQKNSVFLYILLKSAAKAVLKLMSAVIAIEHVLFVSIKSLSVKIMLLEYSFGRLKYYSTTLLMSGFLGSSPISATFLGSSPISAYFPFLGPIPTPRTKISIDIPVHRIPGI